MEGHEQSTGGEAKATEAAQEHYEPGYIVPGSEEAWREELIYDVVARN